MSLSQKNNLFELNVDIMNKFLKFKELELSSLEAEISLKDKLYKRLFDFSPDAFVIFNNDNIVYFNDSFSKLVGASDDNNLVLEKITQVIHPDYMNIVEEAYTDLLSKDTDVNIVNIKILSLNNIIKRVRVSSSVTFFEDNVYIFSCFHDLSEHYKQERLRVELENNVAREKFKVEYFANISHDIKTPINVIYSSVQLLEMYTQDKDYNRLLEYNRVIKQNCLRLQKLLNDVLDITKIDANHFKPNPEPFDIISSIENITQSITSYIEHNNVSIIFDTNVEFKLVVTDYNFIERIILNLVSNAIKYSKIGGNVWVTLHDEGRHLIISIKDDGIGIPQDQIPKIFNRFHKTNQINSNAVSSNGIGLSLVKSMVGTLGGTIFCLSTENIGSEFVVILPMESLETTDYDCYEHAASLDLNTKLNIELSDI